MSLQHSFEKAGRWLADFVLGTPEGVGKYDKESKAGYAPFSALFVFVVTQNGALTLAEHLDVNRSIPVTVFAVVSTATLVLLAVMLRLVEGNPPNEYHYFDRGSILFGKFVLYASLFGSIIVGYAFVQGHFSARKPQFVGRITMSKPILLLSNLDSTKSIVDESLDANDIRTLTLFANTLSSGLKQTGSSPDSTETYISWSRSPFKLDFNDFRCKLPDFMEPNSSLPFLYVSFPVKSGGTQSAYRLLYFDIVKKRVKDRTFPVRSPFRGDRIVIVFANASDKKLADKEYSLEYENLPL